MGIAPKLSDAELVTLAVIQVLLRFDSEARFLPTPTPLGPWFPYLPTRSAYNKRLAAADSSACDRVAIAVVVGRSFGWWTPPRSNAAAAARPPSALTWEDGPNTATARRIPATFGDCVSI